LVRSGDFLPIISGASEAILFILIDRLKETKFPLVLTINGVSELVVQGATGCYQEVLNLIDYLEPLLGFSKD
jgi:hypothetical protein